MGTKANPGKYDCYANAAADEPLFVLRAKDEIADRLVEIWVALKAGRLTDAVMSCGDAVRSVEASGRLLPYDADKSAEARTCARSMRQWRRRQ